MNPALFLLLFRAGTVVVTIIDPPYTVACAQHYAPGSAAGQLYQPGAAEAQPHFPHAAAGQVL